MDPLQLAIVGVAAGGTVVATVAAAIGLLRSWRVPAPRAAAASRSEAVAEARRGDVRKAQDIRNGLARTRQALFGRLEDLLRGRADLDGETVDEIERLLFGADLGVRTAERLLEAARGAGSPQAVHEALAEQAREILRSVKGGEIRTGRPHVVLVVGVNGSGKTTSIGKLAMRYKREGKSVLVGAGDTFRAAAIEQLGIWAERAGAEFVCGEPSGDPAAVAFDAVKAAAARGVDVVLLDTAGRLQTDQALMDELAKISRVVKKEIPDAPHEVLLVLDANTGQNAIRQAREFQRAVEVDRIVLAKLDGTAKGGVVLGIAEEVGIPVRYVGVGEELDDLADFDAGAFVEALFASD